MANEKKMLQLLAKYDKRIRNYYYKVINELAKIGSGIDNIPDDTFFSFDNYPEAAQSVVNILSNYTNIIKNDLLEGMKTAINYSFIASDMLIGKQSSLSDKAVDDLRERTTLSFLANRTATKEGLSLSQRVWNYAQQTKGEFELGMSEIISEHIHKGISAEELGRALRYKLQNPESMYRRYHLKKTLADGTKRDVVEWRRRTVDADGKVHFMSTDIEHTGTGVYRSARQNALRLAATEINMAYRYADCMRWQSEDFVLGIRIELSDNHPQEDMCDELCGDYPREIFWNGWHPRCICRAVPILLDDDTYDELRILPKEERDKRLANLRIKNMPECYNNYIEANRKRIESAIERGKAPYWIQDNYINGDINKKFRWQEKPRTAEDEKRERIARIAEERHAKRDEKAILYALEIRRGLTDQQRSVYYIANAMARQNGLKKYGYSDLFYLSHGKPTLNSYGLPLEIKQKILDYATFYNKLNNYATNGSLGVRGKRIDAYIGTIQKEAARLIVEGKNTGNITKKIRTMISVAEKERSAVVAALEARRLNSAEVEAMNKLLNEGVKEISMPPNIRHIKDRDTAEAMLKKLWTIDGLRWSKKSYVPPLDAIQYQYEKFYANTQFWARNRQYVQQVNDLRASLDFAKMPEEERKIFARFLYQYTAHPDNLSRTNNALEGFLNYQELRAMGVDFKVVSPYMPTELLPCNGWLKEATSVIDRRLFDKIGEYIPLAIKRTDEGFFNDTIFGVTVGRPDLSWDSEFYRLNLIYHEYGHALDAVKMCSNQDKITGFIKRWDKEFQRGDKYVEMNRILREEFRQAKNLERISSIMQKDNLMSCMDINQAVSNCKHGCIDLDGHAKSYWNMKNRQAELFAHMSEAFFLGNDRIKEILGEQFFEEFMSLFRDLVAI